MNFRLCMLVVLLMTRSAFATELSVGLGAAAMPPAGDDDWRVFPAPSFRFQSAGYSVSTQGPGIGSDLVPSRLVSFGPFARYSGGRDEDDLPDIPASAEVGLSLGSGIPWRVIGVPVPGILTAGTDVSTTWPGGHESPAGQVSLGWVLPATERWTLISNLGLSYFGERYAERFFSLNEAEASRAGVSAFDAEPGWQDLSLGVVSVFEIRPRWSTVVVVSRSRYLGDAADSPVTDLLDNRDRTALVLGFSYQWLGTD